MRSIKTRRSTRQRAGFTLPEVLTALAILAMVMGVVYSSWSALTTATTTSTAAVEGAQRERMALTAVSDALASVVWYESQTESSLELEQEGEFSRLKVIARVPPGFWGDRELAGHSLRRIEFYCEENDAGDRQLIMTQQPVLASTNTTTAHRTILLPRVETFQLTLYTPSAPSSLAANNPTPKNLRPPIPPTAPAKPSPPKTKRPTIPADPAPQPPVPAERSPLPKMARMLVAANEAFPRTRAMPIFASRATHASRLPEIGNSNVVSGEHFADSGFDLSKPDAATRAIFIIDKSFSMRYFGRLDVAKGALKSELEKMSQSPDENGELPLFYLYFFNKNDTDQGPGGAVMKPATSNELQKAYDFIDDQVSKSGNGDPEQVIKAAFTLEPTEIYLLTDTDYSSRRWPEKNLLDLFSSLNSEGKVKVNTVLFADQRGGDRETMLQLIAKQNGGAYSFIDPSKTSDSGNLPSLGD